MPAYSKLCAQHLASQTKIGAKYQLVDKKDCAYCKKIDAIKKWRIKNKDKFKSYTDKWRSKNPDKHASYTKKSRVKNCEKVSEYQHNYYEQNKDKISNYKKQWYLKNKMVKK